MEEWFILTGAVVIATRLMATSRDSGGRAASPPDSCWNSALVWTAVALGLGGLALRLVGFGDSLSGDELGTLWAVEASAAATVERSYSFHGQSPFYYLIAWFFVSLFGETEIILRLPSLLSIAGTGWLIYLTGKLLNGPRAGAFSAVVFWWSFMAFRTSGDARPYGLGLMFGALALYGFVRAAVDGRRTSRMWFVVGGIGLIATHYLLALILLGVGIAYLVDRGLRERYPLKKFGLDVVAMTVLSAPLFPQVYALWNRRTELAWAPEISYQALFFTFGPEVTLVAAGLAAGAFWQRKSRVDGAFSLLIWAAAVPPALLVVLALSGTNLLAARYMVSALIPVCLLAGTGLALMPSRWTHFGWFAWVGLNALAFYGTYLQAGTFTGAGYQDWRGASGALARQLDSDRGAPVLFRSGFVEDDQRALGHPVSSALLAPLRSPGAPEPEWSAVPLTYNWPFSQREDYFERLIPDALDGRDVFYYFSCDCASGTPSAGYEGRFAKWIADRFDGRYVPERLNVGRGMVVIRFAATDATELTEELVNGHDDDAF